jgi:hypothetical protein
MLGTSAALHCLMFTLIPRSSRASSIAFATTVDVAIAVPQATNIVFLPAISSLLNMIKLK